MNYMRGGSNMTSWQTGKRVSATTVSRSGRAAKRGGARRAVRRKGEALKPRERRLLIQLVVCGSVFVMLVAVKLLLPARMEQIHAKLSDAMEQNMDVQAVFSAVGRVFSGESEVVSAADEVYRAVFHPEEPAVETAATIPETEPIAALDTLKGYRPANGAEETEAPADPQPELSTLAYVLYSDQNLPECVSMEQVILGFDYCTPLSGNISSEFGYREHPVEGEEKFHYGVDLVADMGTDISCFADGTITVVGESSSYGKYCIVEHQNGYSTLYAHCDRITASSGASVQEGEKIAEVGDTGMATGPHLHFELQHNGTYLNPIYYVSKI